MSLQLQQVKSEPDNLENYVLVKKSRGRPRKNLNTQKNSLKITLKKLVWISPFLIFTNTSDS